MTMAAARRLTGLRSISLSSTNAAPNALRGLASWVVGDTRPARFPAPAKAPAPPAGDSELGPSNGVDAEAIKLIVAWGKCVSRETGAMTWRRRFLATDDGEV